MRIEFDIMTGETIEDLDWTPPFVPEPTPEEFREAMPALNPGQIRLALLFIGITEEMVDGQLADDAAGLIEWKHRPTYRRLHPLVTGLADHFALPADQVDALWLWAAGL